MVKKRDLVRLLKKNGWWFLRHGGNHDIYTDGNNKEKVPRHKEIKEGTAQDIIRRWNLK